MVFSLSLSAEGCRAGPGRPKTVNRMVNRMVMERDGSPVVFFHHAVKASWPGPEPLAHPSTD